MTVISVSSALSTWQFLFLYAHLEKQEKGSLTLFSPSATHLISIALYKTEHSQAL